MSPDLDFTVAVEELPEEIAVTVGLPPTIGVQVVAPSPVVVATANVLPAHDIQVAVQEPMAVLTEVTLPPVVGISAAAPEIVITTAANVGPRGAQGPPGGTLVSGFWDYDAQTVPPVLPGHVRTSPSPLVVGSQVTVYLANRDDSGLLWNVANIKPGDQLRLRGPAGNVQLSRVTAFDATVPGPTGYATIIGDLLSSTGALSKTGLVEVALIKEAPAGTVGPFREGHTFAVLGLMSDVTALPSFFVPKNANQTVKLHGLHHKLLSGGITIQIRCNGEDVATPIAITSAKSFTSLGGIELADGDEISAVLSSPVASPDTLSATVVLEWSVGDVIITEPPVEPEIDYVRITTTGASFAPSIELAAISTAIVEWTVEEGGAIFTGTKPTINFGSTATRHVQMRVSDGAGNALGDVLTFNLGFDHNDDAGRYNMGAAHDWPSQLVSAVANVSMMSGLVRFAAASTNMASVLDFTGCSDLEFIECFGSLVRGVNLTGCDSLIRLCLEHCDLQQPLNLNPVAGSLYDLRAAIQRSGSLSFVTQTSPLIHQYHQCIRDQVVTNRPLGAMLPVVEEEWIWNSGQSGGYITSSQMGGSLAADSNAYTTANLTNRFPAAHSGAADFRNNALTSINLTGCNGLYGLDAGGNLFNQAAVDAILAIVDGFNTSGSDGRYLRLAGTGNAAPSSAGLAHVTALEGRGWTVNVNAPVSAPTNTAVPTISGTPQEGATLTANPGTWTGSPSSYSYQWQMSNNGGSSWSNLAGVVGSTKSVGAGDVGTVLRVQVIASNAGGPSTAVASAQTATITAAGGSGGTWPWSDTFDRLDAIGLVAVNNGWQRAQFGVGDANIVNNNLVRAETSAYQLLFNFADGAAPADYGIEVDLPQWGTLGWNYRGFFGICLRVIEGVDFSNHGIRILFYDETTLHIGDSTNYNTDDQVVPALNLPASWTDMGAPGHTLGARVAGSQVTVACDGQDVVTVTYAMNVGVAGTAFGFCGEGNTRAYKAIRAFT